MRFLGKYAKKFDSNKNMRNYAENGELCGIVRRTGKCAISHSPHLNVASVCFVGKLSLRAEAFNIVVPNDLAFFTHEQTLPQ